MYIYDRKPSGFQSRSMAQPITSRPAQHHSSYLDRMVSEFLGRGGTNSNDIRDHGRLGQLTTDELSKKLKHLAFLSHFVEIGGKDVWLQPSAIDPGIYDGPKNYKIAGTSADIINSMLQGLLEGVYITHPKFRHIKVALVDLTKDVMRPEFAASFDHKQPVMAASVPKIAPMLAAHQLLQDLRVVVQKQHRMAKDINDLFTRVRQDWSNTQHDHGGRAEPFTSGVSLRGKLVLVNGHKIPLGEPKAPRLEAIFAGSPKAINFKSTGEGKVQLKTIIDGFNQAFEDLAKARDTLNKEEKKGDARRVAEARRKHQESLQKFDHEKAKIKALGFLERMRLMIGGLVPASNYATSTIVRDVGFLYIASTLLQSGLYDTNRNGGLWLGSGYWWDTVWSGLRDFGGARPLATAASLAAFMTLLVQNKLVSPRASASMRCLMQIQPRNPTHPTTISWFEEGLSQLVSLEKVLAKIGVADGLYHECAYIERTVDCGKDRKGEQWELPLRYIAVGLGAKSASELKQLIFELDVCIHLNNRTTSCVKASQRKEHALKKCPL